MVATASKTEASAGSAMACAGRKAEIESSRSRSGSPDFACGTSSFIRDAMQVSHRSDPGKLSWPQDGHCIRVAPLLMCEVPRSFALRTSNFVIRTSSLHHPGVSTVEQLFQISRAHATDGILRLSFHELGVGR